MNGMRKYIEERRAERLAKFEPLSDQQVIEAAVDALQKREGLKYMDCYLVYWQRRQPKEGV